MGMIEIENVCGNCKYHKWDGRAWICECPESEAIGYYTEYSDSCDEWEEK